MPRHISTIDRSELSPDAWRKAIDEKLNEHDQDIAALIGGEQMRADATKRDLQTIVDAGIASIASSQATILEETKKQTTMLDASALEREERKKKDSDRKTRESRRFWLALIGLLVPIVIATVYAIAHVSEPAHAEHSEKEK